MTITVGLSEYGMSGAIFHAPIIAKVAGLELTAIMSSDAAKVQRDYPHMAVVFSLDHLLADKNIMLIVIATPNDTHYEYVRRALEAGKHVVVEKPFTLKAASLNTALTRKKTR